MQKSSRKKESVKKYSAISMPGRESEQLRKPPELGLMQRRLAKRRKIRKLSLVCQIIPQQKRTQMIQVPLSKWTNLSTSKGFKRKIKFWKLFNKSKLAISQS